MGGGDRLLLKMRDTAGVLPVEGKMVVTADVLQVEGVMKHRLGTLVIHPTACRLLRVPQSRQGRMRERRLKSHRRQKRLKSDHRRGQRL